MSPRVPGATLDLLSAEELALLRDIRDFLDRLLAQSTAPAARKARPTRPRRAKPPQRKARLIGIVVI